MEFHDRIPSLLSRIGEGRVESTAYETAWVARVPSLADPNRPAFPAALRWLRDNQLSDGSWGIASPLYAHGNTLATLAGILALSDWGSAEDRTRVDRAVQSLAALAERLSQELHESVTFELLISSLGDEVRSRGFDIPTAPYERYAEAGARKRKLISEVTRRQRTGPTSWWVSLELLGMAPTSEEVAMLDDSNLATNGSILVSTSSTAYYLRLMRQQGKDSPRAHAYLEALCQAGDGGVPCLSPIDGFELSCSLAYLVQAGVSPAALGEGIAKLRRLWTPTGLGFTSHWVSEPDATSLSLFVFRRSGEVIQPDALLPHFNGRHFETFAGERSPSVIVNVHGILALREYPDVPGVDDILQKTLQWMESSIQSAGPPYEDKWFFSPYYPTSRAVHSLTGIHERLAQRCADWLLSSQREDGSWGAHEVATAEETALAAFALAARHLQGHAVPLDALRRARVFLARPECDSPKVPLWIHHTLYCPTWVAAATVAAARFSLERAF